MARTATPPSASALIPRARVIVVLLRTEDDQTFAHTVCTSSVSSTRQMRLPRRRGRDTHDEPRGRVFHEDQRRRHSPDPTMYLVECPTAELITRHIHRGKRQTRDHRCTRVHEGVYL